jgi:uncharacterized protein (TIGR02246 family)
MKEHTAVGKEPRGTLQKSRGMKNLLTISCLSLLIITTASGQTARQKNDQLQIEKAITNWETAWRTKNVQLAAQDYSNDADWTNAFGMIRKGRVEIESVLRDVFALPFVMVGNSKTIEQKVTFLKPDVATVVTRVEREGQKMRSGETLPVRKTSHLRIFIRENGRWQIVNHLISDARETEAGRH